MHNFQLYFSKFSQGTCSQHVVNTRKSPLSQKKRAKRSTFSKKVHFLQKSCKNVHFRRKRTPPNPDLNKGLLYLNQIDCTFLATVTHQTLYSLFSLCELYKYYNKQQMNYFPRLQAKGNRCLSERPRVYIMCFCTNKTSPYWFYHTEHINMDSNDETIYMGIKSSGRYIFLVPSFTIANLLFIQFSNFSNQISIKGVWLENMMFK